MCTHVHHGCMSLNAPAVGYENAFLSPSRCCVLLVRLGWPWLPLLDILIGNKVGLKTSGKDFFMDYNNTDTVQLFRPVDFFVIQHLIFNYTELSRKFQSLLSYFDHKMAQKVSGSRGNVLK